MNGRIVGLLVTIVVTLSFILGACQAAPTPTPTKAPAVATAAPAAAPTPTTAAAAAPKGQVTLVTLSEPVMMDAILDANQIHNRAVFPSMVEGLTRQNVKTYGVEPSLATKWEQLKPDTWRYTLRQGVKFHNGEAFNADAVVYSLNRAADKALASKVGRWWPAGGKAVKVDDFTVDITSSDLDPIQPLRLMYAPMVAPKHAQEKPDELATKLYSTGPYKLAEWVKGQYLKMTAFDGYWGTAPKIKDATVVGRAEAAVRTAMVKTGEADWAYNLSPEQAKEVPKYSSVASAETIMVRMDTQNAVLKDNRVRTAMNLAVDKNSIMKNLYGGFAAPANGQIIGSYVIGHNPNLKDYPYDVEQAKKLVAEAKAAGIPTDTTELDIWARKGRMPRWEEMTEVLANDWNKIGVKVKVVIAESAAWSEKWYSVGAGQTRAALGITGHDNFGDSQQTFDGYLVCGGVTSTYCSPALEETAKQSRALTGEARAKAFRDIWQQVYAEAPFVPIFRQQSIIGLSKRLVWEARYDDWAPVQEMTLSE